MFFPSLWCGASTLLHEILIIKVCEHNVTRKLSELSDSHYINNQERTSLLSLKRLQNHIFAVYFFCVQSL